MAVMQLRPNRENESIDYEASGVNSEKAHEGLSLLTSQVTRTWQVHNGEGRVWLNLGHFANVVEIAGQGIAFCTDGVGSKTLVAQRLNKYDTIGIDCVAMNVNDLICVGATPVSMVDYIAIERADPQILGEIGVGLRVGANEAGISISGGEIAQLPGIIRGEQEGCAFDLVGAAIGHVSLSNIITGREVKPGDVIVGVRSNGIHSNGLTLARRVLFQRHGFAIDQKLPELDVGLGEELLKPTFIYVREALEVLRTVSGIKALVHITSDGLGNLARMPPTVAYVIDPLPPVPPIFELIQRLGRVSDKEMFLVYNMGIGFCYIVDEQSADAVIAVIKGHGKEAWRIGHVEGAEKKQVRIPDRNLVLDSFRKLPNCPN